MSSSQIWSSETFFNVSQPNKVWVTDITYIRTWEGWLYVAVVLDLSSRKIIGWAARPTIHRELVLDAILVAVRSRKPKKRLSTQIKAFSKAAMIGAGSVAQTI